MELPSINIFDTVFIEEAKKTDRCSMAPDSISKCTSDIVIQNQAGMLKAIYIGHACYAHDIKYDFIQANIPWWQFKLRKKMYHQANVELKNDIIEIGKRAGVDISDVAQLYYEAVERFGLLWTVYSLITGKN